MEQNKQVTSRWSWTFPSISTRHPHLFLTDDDTRTEWSYNTHEVFGQSSHWSQVIRDTSIGSARWRGETMFTYCKYIWSIFRTLHKKIYCQILALWLCPMVILESFFFQIDKIFDFICDRFLVFAQIQR